MPYAQNASSDFPLFAYLDPEMNSHCSATGRPAGGGGPTRNGGLGAAAPSALFKIPFSGDENSSHFLAA